VSAECLLEGLRESLSKRLVHVSLTELYLDSSIKQAGWCRRFVCIASILSFLFALSGCSDTPALSLLPPNAKIVAFGDSLTFGTGVAASASYPAVLADLSGLNVVRSGVPGEISATGLRRLSIVLAEESPHLVVICHGGNDVLRRLSAKKTEQNLRAMVALVRASGAEVVLVAVPKIGLFPTAWDYYEDIARELDVPIEFEIISDLQRNPALKSDQVHFNREGYRQMAGSVVNLLKTSGAL
jgi:acyl-CoA thioesterase-1